MSDERTKEEVYDAEINPLMAQIIEICKQRQIPMLASFSLDREEGLKCTTALLDEQWEVPEELFEACKVIYTGGRPLMKLTTKNDKGETTAIEVIA